MRTHSYNGSSGLHIEIEVQQREPPRVHQIDNDKSRRNRDTGTTVNEDLAYITIHYDTLHYIRKKRKGDGCYDDNTENKIKMKRNYRPVEKSQSH